jgi:type IV secretory pathway VirB2 component (pilin)
MPVRVLAQGSPFDTGFNAIQSLFTGTIAKVASLVAIVIGGYGFAQKRRSLVLPPEPALPFSL